VAFFTLFFTYLLSSNTAREEHHIALCVRHKRRPKRWEAHTKDRTRYTGSEEMSMPATLSRKIQKVLETKTDSPDLLVALQNLSTFYGINTPSARTNLRGR